MTDNVTLTGWTFAQTPIWAICDDRLTDKAVRVFGYLYYRQGTNPDCWPSVNKIAEDMGCSHDTINRALKNLDDLGYVVIKHRQGRSSKYTVIAQPEGAADYHPDRKPHAKVREGSRKSALPTTRKNASQNDIHEREIIEPDPPSAASSMDNLVFHVEEVPTLTEKSMKLHWMGLSLFRGYEGKAEVKLLVEKGYKHDYFKCVECDTIVPCGSSAQKRRKRENRVCPNCGMAHMLRVIGETETKDYSDPVTDGMLWNVYREGIGRLMLGTQQIYDFLYYWHDDYDGLMAAWSWLAKRPDYDHLDLKALFRVDAKFKERNAPAGEEADEVIVDESEAVKDTPLPQQDYASLLLEVHPPWENEEDNEATNDA